MLSRSDVVGRYRALLRTEVFNSQERTEFELLLERLPPTICRAVLLGASSLSDDPMQLIDELEYLDSGSFEVAGLRVLQVPMPENIMRELPLEGHASLAVPGLSGWISQSLRLLEEISGFAYQIVTDWVSLIAWVAPDKDFPPDALLTSVAIPALPHCVFISVKSLRHLPAKHVYSGASIYALAENIYHESLHQQLSCSLIFDDIFDDSIREVNRLEIDIPWRKTQWPVDRVLHAAWVYNGLQNLRAVALSDYKCCEAERSLIKNAYEESKPKLEYLKGSLDTADIKFSKIGHDMFAELLTVGV